MQPRHTPRCDSTFLQLFCWEFQHPKHLLLGLCGTILTASLWVLILFPENVLSFHLVFFCFPKLFSQQGDTHQILCIVEEKSISPSKCIAKPAGRGLTLIRFMRFDEIECSSQSKNLFFVAHVEEMANEVTSACSAQWAGNIFKAKIFTSGIFVSNIKCSQYFLLSR